MGTSKTGAARVIAIRKEGTSSWPRHLCCQITVNPFQSNRQPALLHFDMLGRKLRGNVFSILRTKACLKLAHEKLNNGCLLRIHSNTPPWCHFCFSTPATENGTKSLNAHAYTAIYAHTHTQTYLQYDYIYIYIVIIVHNAHSILHIHTMQVHI